MNPNFKTFQAFFTKCAKNSLPITRNMKVQSGKAVITDLETTVTFTCDLPDGYYTLKLNQAFLVAPLNDDFPMVDNLPEETSKAILKPELFIHYAPCAANDPLRPALSSIYISSTDGICASDAHVLKAEFENRTTMAQMDRGFKAIVPPTPPIMAKCKQANGDIIATLHTCVDNATEPTHISLDFGDGCTIIQKLVQDQYPKFKSVIPQLTDEYKFIAFDAASVLEMGKTQKAFDARGVRIGEKNSWIGNPDLKMEKTFSAPTSCQRPDEVSTSVIMPMDMQEESTEHYLMINAINMARLITPGFKGKLIIAFRDVTRPMLFWLKAEVTKALSPKPAPAPAQEVNHPEHITAEEVEEVQEAEVIEEVEEVQPDEDDEPIQISDPERVEPDPVPAPAPAPKQQPKAAPAPAPEETKTERIILSPKAQIPRPENPIKGQIIPYSPKSFALVSDETKNYKDLLKQIGGQWNPYLKIDNQPVKAWVFSLSRIEQVKQLIAS